MLRSQLKRKFNNKKSEENSKIYKQKRNYCEKLTAGSFNNYNADSAKTLKLKRHLNFDGQSLFSMTDYFKNDESVIKIKEKYDIQENSFSFI